MLCAGGGAAHISNSQSGVLGLDIVSREDWSPGTQLGNDLQ